MKEYLLWVGGRYRPATFLAEARASGINRRVSLNMAGALSYGDRVWCGFWESRNSVPPPGVERVAGRIVASFRTNTITLPAEIAQQVGEELDRQSKVKAVDAGGPVMVYRECGSYQLGVSITVDADLGEIVEIAKEVAKTLGDGAGDKLQIFIGGRLEKVYEPPLVVLQGVPFTRGLQRYSPHGEQSGDGGAAELDMELMGMLSYEKRTRKERTNMTIPLGLETAVAA